MCQEFFKPKMTTDEMDGLFTQEDVSNRHLVMRQCTACNDWSQHNTLSSTVWHCKCGSEAYDRKGQRSIRTWLVTKDLKKARVSRKKTNA